MITVQLLNKMMAIQVEPGTMLAHIAREHYPEQRLIAVKLNEQWVNIQSTLDADAEVFFVFEENATEALEIIRHSTAHLLAHAVKRLFPTAKVAIGPVIENGFYYDFDYERPFTPEDLAAIEKEMKNLAKASIGIERQLLGRDEALALFKSKNETYKVALIEAIPVDESISVYHQDDFIDLCRGPHVPNTRYLKAFRLMKLAGAYWRGDANNQMLQRIYGTAWRNKTELSSYLTQLEEAEKRDHRKIGKQLDLFHFQDLAPGMVFWHARGWVLYQVIEQYMRKAFKEMGYLEVKTPQILSRELWEKTGHWDNYRNEMFTTQSEERDFAIKPMNCPCHVQLFNHSLRSYRDLPLRFAEFGSCHRNELSGALHGLMRVRGFVQDDGHIFCTIDQVQAEVSAQIAFTRRVYRDFGFTDLQFKLSTRPPNRVGEDSVWDTAEAALAEALNANGIEWTLNPGDGAFYGPKIDFSLRDCLGRIWQCATIQLDFSIPSRLGATYIGEDSKKHTPVMIHRAIFGSMERFIGILIEHYAGKLPVWLAPVQIVLMNVSEKHAERVQDLEQILKKNGLRAHADLRNEKIGFKIREHTLQRVPYLIVVGDKEMTADTLSVRARDADTEAAVTMLSIEELTALVLDSEKSERG